MNRRLWLFLASILTLLPACGGSNAVEITPPPVPDTRRTIQGQVAYFTTGPDLNGRDAFGRIIPVPGFVAATYPRGAPRFPVEVLAPDGTLLGETVSDDNGRYALTVNFGQNPASQVKVRMTARLDLGFGAKVRCRPSAGAPVYAFETPLSGNPAVNPMTIDVAVPLDQGAAAFHILDAIYEGMIAGKSGITGTVPDLDVLWAPGNGAQSSYTVGKLTIAGGVAGDPSSNQDAWDSPQIMRLLGLFFLAHFFREVAPPGTANDAALVPSAAWREGFLDFWACAARNSPEFWDTEGSGAQGHVVRFFNIESYFDPAIGSLGPDDPNVYQPAGVTGIGSAFSVAEILWDLYDHEVLGDGDRIQFPLFLLLRALANAQPGQTYPYLMTLFDEVTKDQSLDPVSVHLLLQYPEDQGMQYPATSANGMRWPVPFLHPTVETSPIAPPYDKTLSDVVDTLNPVPINLQIGFWTQRYFSLDLAQPAHLVATLTTGGALLLDLLDFENRPIANGVSSLDVALVPAGRYVLRVQSAANPQVAPFDLRLQLLVP